MSALPSAIAFAAAVNFLLVARFVYPEWLTLTLVRMAGWVAVACWLFCVQRSAREMPALLHPRSASDQPDRFGEAHRAYLRGQWAQAESLLTDCLSIENRDPPALLLLAGVYRHTARLEAAARLIEEIRRTEAADRWFLEIAAEEQRLQRDQNYQNGEHHRSEQGAAEVSQSPLGGEPQLSAVNSADASSSGARLHAA